MNKYDAQGVSYDGSRYNFIRFNSRDVPEGTQIREVVSVPKEHEVTSKLSFNEAQKILGDTTGVPSGLQRMIVVELPKKR